MAAAAIPAVISGLGALTGLFGNKQSSGGSINQTTNSSPTYDPTQQAFRDMLISQFSNLSNPDTLNNFMSAYQTGGLKNIKSTNDMAAQGVNNLLESRGLLRTGAGVSADTDSAYRSGKQISDFLTSLPLVRAQQNLTNLGAAGSFFNSLPYGQTQNVQGTQKGNYTFNGGAGGAVQGGSTALGGILGQIFAKQLNKPASAPAGGYSDNSDMPNFGNG